MLCLRPFYVFRPISFRLSTPKQITAGGLQVQPQLAFPKKTNNIFIFPDQVCLWFSLLTTLRESVYSNLHKI